MKKGFTLIEIIMCIGVLAVIGTASFFGIKMVRKNITIDRLEQISESILQAAEVYIEKNSEVKNQLYREKNGVVIPLNVLKNEGLVDFSKTKLNNTAIKDEYVVALLGEETPKGNECISTTIQKSWIVNNKPIYICTKSDGSSNLISVGALDNNLGAILEKKYFFSGVDIDNWIEYGSTKYRIISIDTDDSITIYKLDNSDFGETFNGKTMSTSYVNNTFIQYERENYGRDYGYFISCPEANQSPLYKNQYGYFEETSYKGVKVDLRDIINTSICLKTDYYYMGWQSGGTAYLYTTPDASVASSSFSNLSTWIPFNVKYQESGWNTMAHTYLSSTTGYKVHLRPCMKIEGGTGDFANPYQLKDKCTTS